MNNTASYMVKLGAVLLTIQNAMFYAFFSAETESLTNLLILILYLDLAGFGLLAVGYILHSRIDEEYINFQWAGISILGFILFRSFWQFGILDFANLSRSIDLEVNSLTFVFDSIIYSFLLSAISLFFAGVFVNRAYSKYGKLFLIYGSINVLAVFLTLSPLLFRNTSNMDGTGFILGIFAKFLIVPGLGVLLFAIIALKTKDHLQAIDDVFMDDKDRYLYDDSEEIF